MKETFENILKKYPRFEALTNLLNQLEELEASPDTVVDYAHSLTEGVVKNTRHFLDQGASERDIEKQTNTKKHLNALKIYLEQLDNDFDLELFEKLIEVLENTRDKRNNRGDTSHGHLGPKEYTSEVSARFWLDIAIAHARYIFALLDRIDGETVPYAKNSNYNKAIDIRHQRFGKN